jgi:hypothetical protein
VAWTPLLSPLGTRKQTVARGRRCFREAPGADSQHTRLRPPERAKYIRGDRQCQPVASVSEYRCTPRFGGLHVEAHACTTLNDDVSPRAVAYSLDFCLLGLWHRELVEGGSTRSSDARPPPIGPSRLPRIRNNSTVRLGGGRRS